MVRIIKKIPFNGKFCDLLLCDECRDTDAFQYLRLFSLGAQLDPYQFIAGPCYSNEYHSITLFGVVLPFACGPRLNNNGAVGVWNHSKAQIPILPGMEGITFNGGPISISFSKITEWESFDYMYFDGEPLALEYLALANVRWQSFNITVGDRKLVFPESEFYDGQLEKNGDGYSFSFWNIHPIHVQYFIKGVEQPVPNRTTFIGGKFSASGELLSLEFLPYQ